jgi:hypothetical protein
LQNAPKSEYAKDIKLKEKREKKKKLELKNIDSLN